MSVRFSCAVCCAFFCVLVCNTVLEYVSKCDLIWDSGLSWGDCSILVYIELFRWGEAKGITLLWNIRFSIFGGTFISLSKLLRTFFA
jgi:hypothetical protein